MILFDVDVTTLAFVAALMVACGGGIGRLLWLIEGRPHLDRPKWWPGGATAAQVAPPASVAAVGTSTRAASAVACAVCCGVPMVLVVGALGVGVVATFSLGGGALLAGALVAWSVATGRATRWRRMLARAGRSR
jgi:hypothetical protein